MRHLPPKGGRMNVKLDVKVDDFIQHINEVKRESGRSSEEMLKYVMILMLQAGRSNTKLGKKNRALTQEENEPDQDADDAGITKDTSKVRFFKVYNQGSREPKKVFVPSIPRQRKNNEAERAEAMRARDAIVAKFKRIKRRGIAQDSWGWAMKMLNSNLGVAVREESQSSLSRNNPIEIARQFSGTSPSIEVMNKLGWIRNLTPDIEQRMINSADARMMHVLDKQMQGAIDKAERKAK